MTTKKKPRTHAQTKCRFCTRLIAPQGRKHHEMVKHSGELQAMERKEMHTFKKALRFKKATAAMAAISAASAADNTRLFNAKELEDSDFVLMPVRKVDIMEALRKLLV